MTKERDYNRCHKLRSGPGGIRCGCCSPYGRMLIGRQKTLMRRRLRRFEKHLFKQQINSDLKSLNSLNSQPISQ